MTIRQTIDGIKEDIEAALTVELAGRGLPPVEYFGVGYPFEQDKLSCCVRLSKFEYLGDLGFIVHLSLPGLDEGAAYDYLQAVVDYLTNFDTVDYGYYTGTFILQFLEGDFNNGDVQALFMATLKNAADDCDL